MKYLLICILVLGISFIISKQKPEYRKILIISNSIISIFYILWRLTTIPINNGIVSFILGMCLFLAEIIGLVSFFNFQYLFIKKYKLEKKNLEDFCSTSIPSVDVLICTYNEPISLLKKTIVASLKINYPCNKFKVYVCDDGHRDELKDLCNRYSVGYITRENNEGAKAGNINNALKHITGDLFAVLDADMIPKKDFLNKTVGYFASDNTAFVQTPQVYYNQDMYQYNFKENIPNEQDFFMRDIEEARASRNAVLHVGTNAVFRKKYVEEIGGYPTCSITEDMAVGMLLQSKGYDTVFVNEVLVLGLSATTFSELVKQRDRWCRGNLQVIKKFNPLFTKGLNLPQKIAYLDGVVYWFSSIQKMIYIFCPLIFLLFGKLIINANASNLFFIFTPYLLGQILIFKTLSPNTRSLTWAHFYEIAMAPHISFSVLKEMLFLKTKFNVTSKDIVNDRKYFQFKVALPHIIICILSILSWFTGYILLSNGKIELFAYIINITWSIYNFIGALVSLKVAYQKPIFRSTERIEVNEIIYISINDSIIGTISDISEKGIGVKLNSDILFKLNQEININIKNKSFKCTVARCSNKSIGLEFKDLTLDQLKLIMDIFTDNMTPYYKTNRSQEYIEYSNAS